MGGELLDEADFLDWCSRLRLTPVAREMVATIRSEQPARCVGGGRRNVAGRYPSRKMGFTIQFESHRVELPFIYEAENDPQVLEYYDQPSSIPLVYRAANGRNLSVLHTADYFVLRKDSARWVECKTEEELELLASRTPNRYSRDSRGKWRCAPGEDYAASVGLVYEVWSAAQVNWTLQRNLQFLEDYLRFAPAKPSPFLNPAIKAAVDAQPAITLLNLLERMHGIVEPDEIYMLIVSGDIYVDLSAAPIAEPERVHIYGNAELAAAYKFTCIEDATGSAIHGCGRRHPPSPNVHSEAFVLLAAASDRDLSIANLRFEIVRQHLAGDKPTSPMPARTLRLWMAQYRHAKERYGSGYLGLLPRVSRRGNRSSRLSDASQALLTQFVESDYEDLRQKSLFASWAALKHKCHQVGIVAPSHVTFNAAVRRRPSFDQTLKRKGPRAAYAQSSFYFELERTTPRHGDRPFEIGHIDHTQLDVEVVCSRTGRPLGRPWMTILTDAFSRRCLALYLTFDEPSYRSCMMILRDCVLRHQRLPQIIVIDGGPEFRSTYFESLLAEYECTKKTRPPAKARFGSICERLFGTTNTQFLHNLRGNTQITRNVRQVTKSNKPAGQAAWTLRALSDYLSSFLFEVYDNIDHPALGQTPRDAYMTSVKTTGIRTNRTIAYDQAFLMATLPTTPRGTARVAPGRGIKINGLNYWAEAFRDPSVERHDVAIRYDPFDMGTAYAFVKNRWTECHSEHYAILHGRSQKEIALASKETRRRYQLYSRGRFTMTARKLAEFLASAESEEKHLLQQLRDSEDKAMRQSGIFIVSSSRTGKDLLPGTRAESSEVSCEVDQPRATAIYEEF